MDNPLLSKIASASAAPPQMFVEAHINGHDVTGALGKLTTLPQSNTIQIGIDSEAEGGKEHLSYLGSLDRCVLVIIVRIRYESAAGISYSPYQATAGVLRMSDFQVMCDGVGYATVPRVVDANFVAYMDMVAFGDEENLEEIDRHIRELMAVQCPHTLVYRTPVIA